MNNPYPWSDITDAEKIETLRRTNIWLGELVRGIGLALAHLGNQMAMHGEDLRLAYGAKPSADIERERKDSEKRMQEFMQAVSKKAADADAPTIEPRPRSE